MNKKKKVLLSIVLSLCLCFGILIGARFNIFFKIANKFDNIVEYYQRNHIDKKLENELQGYSAFENDNNAWYYKYKFISHSGGAIEGKKYTNSMEAWKNSYQNGNRIFDADLRFSSDGKLILRHHWGEDFEQGNFKFTEFYTDDRKVEQIKEEELPSSEEFKNTLIYNKYHSMNFDDVITFMKEHNDVYLATDAKVDYEKVYSYIYKNCPQDLLDRIIISVYTFDDYYKIKKVCPIKNWAIRQYMNYSHNYYELAKFCLDNDIKVVNISKERVDSDDISILLEKNIKLFCETVDTEEEMSKYQEKGITRFCYK